MIGFIKNSTMQGIANAIRTKNDTEAQYLPKEMPEAILAIGDTDTLGDKIMNGTITNLDSSSIEVIRERKMYKREYLTSVKLPNIRAIGLQAFLLCYSLTKVDLGNSHGSEILFASRCFAYTGLDTFIIRCPFVCGYTGLDHTPIESGTGYIYVPNSLVSSYKAATGWSTYASQIRAIEDYPDICG